MTRERYIELYKETVQIAVKGSGLFASVMMAQAILESSDKNGVPGNSTLARVYHNHFGIKADKSWKGQRVNLKTREVFNGNEVMVGEYFRVYESATQSFMDRVQFLSINQRYQRAGVFQAATPDEQAGALQTAGYATDPNYGKLISKLIEKLNLQELDNDQFPCSSKI